MFASGVGKVFDSFLEGLVGRNELGYEGVVESDRGVGVVIPNGACGGEAVVVGLGEEGFEVG